MMRGERPYKQRSNRREKGSVPAKDGLPTTESSKPSKLSMLPSTGLGASWPVAEMLLPSFIGPNPLKPAVEEDRGRNRRVERRDTGERSGEDAGENIVCGG